MTPPKKRDQSNFVELDVNTHCSNALDAMTSTASSFKCDYLSLYTSPTLRVFSSDKAELIFLDEQISSLDSHIFQLNTVLGALHHRSRQLHNLLAPIQALPIEVLSYIFRQVVDSGRFDIPRSNYSWQCLRDARRLASVSTQFRHVALGTPELWKLIPLKIPNWKAIGNASFLLRHCTALAVNVHISISIDDELDEENARSAFDTLFTSDTMQKIKVFDVSESREPELWVEKLTGSSFPMLDTLRIHYKQSFNIGALKTVTRLEIYKRPRARCRGPVILPPSVRYVEFANVSQQELVSLLYQCPNLVECSAMAYTYIPDEFNDNTQFNKPLTLNGLKRLTLEIHAISAVVTPLAAQNFRLPSLEFLQLVNPPENAIIGILSFCCNLSATLTTLIIDTPYGEFDDDDLYRLCKLPFPKLRKLEYKCLRFKHFRRAVHALARLDGECCNREDCHLPALESIILEYWGGSVEPRSLPDLVKEWRIGEAFYFHLWFDRIEHNQWTATLLDELRSNVGSRKIEITWGSCRLQESYVQDGSLLELIQE